jgi:signal transduction histidine kinase
MNNQISPDESIFSLVTPIDALSPDLPLEEVANLFADPRNAKLLSLPVVENGRPIGVISRYQFMNIYLKRYARELYGKRALRGFINNTPLLVELDQPLTEAAQHIATNMQFPLTEDFIVTRRGRYLGIGFVMDLLKAMEVKVRSNTMELERAYSQLKTSQLALVQSEKMASLGQMVAGVAHEINTPLGYVQNNVVIGQDLFSQVQLMISDYESLFDMLMDASADEHQIAAKMQKVAAMRNDANVQEMLGEMNGLMADSLYGIEQISGLVHDLKNFSRMDAAANDLSNPNDCIESALNIGRNVLKNKLEVVKDLAQIPEIMCSPSQLNQVFLNLFTNAAQAMETQGKLFIKSWHDATYIHINITDTGKGMPQEIVSRIFDPFFTTKPVGEGTGLGLAISLQIIQQHGGNIQVESRIGEGSSFHITLPLSNNAKKSVSDLEAVA